MKGPGSTIARVHLPAKERDRAEATAFLAAVLRDFAFATVRVPDALRRATHGALAGIRRQLALDEVDAFRLTLPYEPRSLAVHPGGEVVAVGTKAGTVHLARWDRTTGRWHAEQIPDRPDEAVRALAFIGSACVLAAQGAGRFKLFSTAGGLKTEGHMDGVPPPYHPWQLRLRRLISVVPQHLDACEGSATWDGPLAVGLSTGGGVVVIGPDGGSVPIASVARNRETVAAYIVRLARKERILDAAWSDEGHLFLLDASGTLTQLAVDRACVVVDVGTLKVPGYKCISACPAALVLLARDEVLPVRLGHPSRRLLKLHPSAAPARVSEATGVAVAFPFHHGPINTQATSTDAILTVVPTQGGLVVLPWVDDGKRGLVPSSQPRPTGLAEGAVLYAAFGTRQAAAARTAHFLAYATRSSELVIWSLLDRTPLREILNTTLRQDVAQDPQSPATQWVHAAWRIRNEVTSGDPYRHLSLQRGADLNRLLNLLLQRLRKEVMGPPEKARQFVDHTFEAWLYALLRRAHEVDDRELPRRLGQILRTSLAKLRSRGRPDEPVVLARLEVLDSFVGKWVVEGRTFGERNKPTGLTELVKENERNHRSLDALVYLARLLHERIDRRWIATPLSGCDSLSPAIWDLQMMPDGSFSVQSHADGSVTAVSNKGRTLVWQAAEHATKKLRDACLELNGTRLAHRQAAKFQERYRHGPYARSMALLAVGEVAVLLFAMKGFRREDRDASKETFGPSLHTLVVRARKLDPNLAHPDALEIIDVRSRSNDDELHDELYGLCVLDYKTPPAGGMAATVLAGTNGSYDNKPVPFVEVRIVMGPADTLRPLDLRVPDVVPLHAEVAAGAGYGRPPGAAGAHNPCVALAIERTTDRETWAWTGFHDGHLRGYLREGMEVSRWHEGGGATKRPEGHEDAPLRRVPRRSGVRAAGAIWALHCVDGRSLRPKRPAGLLAYGTAEGVIGLVEVAAAGDSPRAPRHLVHARERAPIARLVEVVDEGRVRLTALTHGGVGVFFDLGMKSDGAVEAAAAERSPAVFGERVERRRLAPSARAIAVLPGEAGRDPAVRVGTAEGEVHEVKLALPLRSNRRSDAAATLAREVRHCVEAKRGDAPASAGKETFRGEAPEREPLAYIGLTDVVAKDRALAWLRVLPVGTSALAWASFWAKLHAHGQKIRDTQPEDVPQGDPAEAVRRLADEVGHLERCTKEFADEAYARRPFTAESAKIIWAEVGAVAKRCMAGALSESAPLELRRALLRASERLLRVVDGLNDRWAGFSAEVEAPVLMHAFATIDWPAVALLALPDDHTELEDEMRPLRPLLLRKILRRRMTHSDELVTLETIRVLGRAMLRALRLSKTPRGNVPRSLLEMLALVAGAGVRLRSRLSSADPLLTELARLFAGGMLLVPHAVTLILELLSENGLLEPSLDVCRALHAELERLPGEIGVEEGGPVLRLFEDYTGPVGETIGLTDAIRAEFPNCAFLEEQRRIREIALALRRLRGPTSESVLAWLDASEWIFFERSPAALRYLNRRRSALAVLEDKQEAIKQCHGLLEWLNPPDPDPNGAARGFDLYDPYRSTWREIPKEWIRELEGELAWAAVLARQDDLQRDVNVATVRAQEVVARYRRNKEKAAQDLSPAVGPEHEKEDKKLSGRQGAIFYAMLVAYALLEGDADPTDKSLALIAGKQFHENAFKQLMGSYAGKGYSSQIPFGLTTPREWKGSLLATLRPDEHETGRRHRKLEGEPDWPVIRNGLKQFTRALGYRPGSDDVLRAVLPGLFTAEAPADVDAGSGI